MNQIEPLNLRLESTSITPINSLSQRIDELTRRWIFGAAATFHDVVPPTENNLTDSHSTVFLNYGAIH